jgi:AraC-like DNA-binding protein
MKGLNMKPMTKTILAGLMAMMCGGMVAQAKPAGPMPVYYRVVLDRGVTYPERPEDARDLMLDLEQVGDQWGAVYGVARNYNMPFHKGAVSDAKVSADTITLKIGMDIQSDKWIPGGQGVYEITLKRQADGKWAGPFTGEFKGIPVKGQATATTYAPQRASDFLPIAPQEHPRLLFRKHDLEKLREKAKTPFGQAAMKKLEAAGTPASFGLLYQLTGDKQWAEKAVTEAEEYLAGRKPPGDPFVPKRPLWGQLEQLALVYDLCYDALPADFKSRYRAWIADLAFQLYFATEALGVTNWHVVSNHVANVYAGVLMAALALFDEPAPAPQEPTPPFLDGVLPPAKDFVAAPGDQVIVASLHPFSTSAIDGPVRFLQLDFRMISTAPDQDLLSRVGLPAQVTARDRQRLFERCRFLHEHPPYGKLPAAIRLQSRPVAEQLITQYFLDGFETDAFAAGAQSVPEWLVQIRQHIAENFTGKIDMTALARHSGYCRSHLNHEFRRVFGRSPMRLVLELRLGVAAQRLISNPDESIGEIAADCGFHSHSHFGRWFRQKYGISPSDWRQHRREPADSQ